MNRIFISIAFCIFISSCGNRLEEKIALKTPVEFDQNDLRKDLKPLDKINGQLLYLPVYSNIPYLIDTSMFDMSAFVAVHNTDLSHPVHLTKVLYFIEDGKLVDDFLKNGQLTIGPLATRNFYIPYEDKSGNGANFLIEWISDTLVNEPLIESITLCLKPNNTLAIKSLGRVMSQNR